MNEEQIRLFYLFAMVTDSILSFQNVLSALSLLPGSIMGWVGFVLAIVVCVGCFWLTYFLYEKWKISKIARVTKALLNE